jgi:hypothetical protein
MHRVILIKIGFSLSMHKAILTFRNEFMTGYEYDYSSDGFKKFKIMCFRQTKYEHVFVI